MLRYILKLWSNNINIFSDVIILLQQKKIDGIELYNNVNEPIDWSELEKLKDANIVGIHNPHSNGWHDYFLTAEQSLHWEQTRHLADYFSAKKIIIHPARMHNQHTFWNSLWQLGDSRIMIENMSGVDVNGKLMEFGHTLEDLQEIKKQTPICFDIEKAMKSAVYQKLDYKKYISKCVEMLEPTYFHISGGDISSPIDQHLDLWDGGVDWLWIKTLIGGQARENNDVYLVFETPKINGLENDVKNMEYFRAL